MLQNEWINSKIIIVIRFIRNLISKNLTIYYEDKHYHSCFISSKEEFSFMTVTRTKNLLLCS